MPVARLDGERGGRRVSSGSTTLTVRDLRVAAARPAVEVRRLAGEVRVVPGDRVERQPQPDRASARRSAPAGRGGTATPGWSSSPSPVSTSGSTQPVGVGDLRRRARRRPGRLGSRRRRALGARRGGAPSVGRSCARAGPRTPAHSCSVRQPEDLREPPAPAPRPARGRARGRPRSSQGSAKQVRSRQSGTPSVRHCSAMFQRGQRLARVPLALAAVDDRRRSA